MDTRLPLRVSARDNDARFALEQELHAKQLPLEVFEKDGHPNETAVLEMPSDLVFLEPVINYLTKLINSTWSISADRSQAVAIALQEALVNAVKHGNQSDPAKQVVITTEVSNEEARFVMEDEGDGFEKDNPPDPLLPDNLYKSSGRGVLLIKSIMDETEYNDRGNIVTMIKKRSSLDQLLTQS